MSPAAHFPGSADGADAAVASNGSAASAAALPAATTHGRSSGGALKHNLVATRDRPRLDTPVKAALSASQPRAMSAAEVRHSFGVGTSIAGVRSSSCASGTVSLLSAKRVLVATSSTSILSSTSSGSGASDNSSASTNFSLASIRSAAAAAGASLPVHFVAMQDAPVERSASDDSLHSHGSSQASSTATSSSSSSDSRSSEGAGCGDSNDVDVVMVDATHGTLSSRGATPMAVDSPSYQHVNEFPPPTPTYHAAPKAFPQLRPSLDSPTAPLTEEMLRPHPLFLPEILTIIFAYLETPLNTGTDPTQPLDFVKVDSIKYSISKPKLHSCMLVCKLWNMCAAKHLYRNIKSGSESGCRKLARTLFSNEGQMRRHASRSFFAPFLADAKETLSEEPICWADKPLDCQHHRGMEFVPSPLNGYVYGNTITSFSLIPPHGLGVEAFAQCDVDAVVSTLALTCPKLRELNLSNCSQVTDASIVIVARHCHQLRRLNLNRCDLVSTAAVRELASSRISLEILNLSRPLLSQRTTVEDDAILSLVRKMPDLMELRLRNCDLLSDRTVIEMASTCGANLRALDLSWCSRLTDKAIKLGIAPNCPRLLSLALNGCKKLTDSSLLSLLSGCPNMASLSLAHLPFITDVVLKNMASKLKDLVILSLNGCVNVGDESVIALSENCSHLQSLSLFSLNITDESVKSIAKRCPKLISLSISSCKNVTDAGAIHITELVRLNSLYLNGANITDKSVIAIVTKCRWIRALSLNDCTALTDRSIVVLSKYCNQLQSLSMNGCGITAIAVKALVDRCNDLRELSVKACTQCVLEGPEAKLLVFGNGGMDNLSTSGAEVMAKLIRRRIAVMKGV